MRLNRSLVAVVFVVMMLCCGVLASSVWGASEAATAWSVQVVAQPTVFSSAQTALCEEARTSCDAYVLVPFNVGGRESSGTVTVTDTLPAGVSLVEAGGGNALMGWGCSSGEASGRTEVTCTSSGAMGVPALTPAAGVRVRVEVPSVPGPLVNDVVVSGGGALAPASVAISTAVGEPASGFEVNGFTAGLLGAGGGPDTVAGDHPDGQFTSFSFPSAFSVIPPANGRSYAYPVQDVKQIVTELPPGLIGDALAAPTCPLTDVSNLKENEVQCPAATRIGKLALIDPESPETELTIFNVTPEHGYPAEFAAFLPNPGRAALLYARVVGSGAGTHVQVTSAPQNSIIPDGGVSLTFFGDPRVLDGGALEPEAFFTSPSDCQAGGFTSTVFVDSWQAPGVFNANGEPVGPNWESASSTAPPVSGCGALQFHPSFSLTPTATTPDTPTGFGVDLQVPQNEDPLGLATPPLKSVTVTLPQGLVVSPSSANGLEACSDEQIDLASNVPGSCPLASEIGSVVVHTPLLSEPLEGGVFLGSPECSPCSSGDAQSGRLVRLFIQASSERYGVTIKSEGTVSIDPATGRLVSTFESLPQQPFSDLEFKFKEGPRAPLATPAVCGSYETVAAMTPWSTPYTPTATTGSPFTITGCEGNPFNPTFFADDLTTNAGRFSQFELNVSRSDREGGFGVLESVLPVGVLARVAGVGECGEVEIAAARAGRGGCPVGSLLGSVVVGSGPGVDPFYVSGKIYFTGAYNGGPFGVVVVVPAVAGPFNLGDVVVRGSIRINPVTGQGSVVSDPFPSMLDGIPLQERSVDVQLERPGFVFNATSCEVLAVTGTIVSVQGARAALSSRYQASGCRELPFHPVFTVSTQGRASKARGASLTVRMVSKGGPERPVGEEEANIRKVDVQLPVELPSRLTTLQQACTEGQFALNPAGCPVASDVGTAQVNTPLLASPLAGPVYLVSHGGAAFPDVEVVLQGEGVEIVLDGKTQIKKGITYSHFETVPDAPFSVFELKFPEGSYSILGANLPVKDNYDLCGQNLLMPTEITGQNGAVVKQATRISVTGCAKPKAKKNGKASRANRASHTSGVGRAGRAAARRATNANGGGVA
jgi:hypothetical protein